MSKEVRALISQMGAENPTWGAPRIHGELLKLASIYRNQWSRDGCGALRDLQISRGAG